MAGAKAGRKAGKAGKGKRPEPRRGSAAAPAPLASPAKGELRVRLQLLAGFLVPLLVLGLWLRSQGFFEGP